MRTINDEHKAIRKVKIFFNGRYEANCYSTKEMPDFTICFDDQEDIGHCVNWCSEQFENVDSITFLTGGKKS